MNLVTNVSNTPTGPSGSGSRSVSTGGGASSSSSSPSPAKQSHQPSNSALAHSQGTTVVSHVNSSGGGSGVRVAGAGGVQFAQYSEQSVKTGNGTPTSTNKTPINDDETAYKGMSLIWLQICGGGSWCVMLNSIYHNVLMDSFSLGIF
ncbi:hypothetical protein M427DRAFT_408562 [Gonapodya prolifera JEL478]|uniref:Uncharacterized protein n=1 Tax=Gonapodya prolifera (strain JEL478) TaxID=1344416 RepID=A0A139A5X7_GONPJ|nr:hypothetical protein M427DRAFT_408562 [Gonapodya prolifera JEL478]|eukprot:KXS12187.1 hypothetical protein M427DRAFT_408562 [Gonapodya prolifera JEL478]